ncbi:PREDICTED: melanoma-associated antigen B4-like [Elephantulus edwardii]|uniref:melanoma-associated antigen B4-like n=1 Tax=Elephantulus edwardii TaxID=28737 RepID=UPI0003F0E121|nr:PREDICTED: melanoma-associated antigen B4-like [Elephantulus edwardii]
MPRSQPRSKNPGQEKCQQVRGDTQDLEGTQATAAGEEGSFPSSAPRPGASPRQSYTVPPTPQVAQRPPPIPLAAEGASCTGDDEVAQDQDDACASSSEGLAATPQKDPLARRMCLFLQFLLHKYQMKELITKAEMMKIINKKYKEHFPEFLQRATEHMELVFGLDLKEVEPKAQVYVIVSKLEFSEEENLSCGRRYPKYGLLMPLLGMMHASNNQAKEEDVWEFLGNLGIYKGKKHFIFGDPRKLLTEDLVREQYLEYRQVPGSDPPRYVFLWGPRACAEANKSKVLEFLVRIRKMDQNAFKTLYLQTWKDEEQREASAEWPGVGVNARARARFRAKSSKASHPSGV